MTDYDGLSALIPKIANAAIDWRMRWIEQWSGDAEHGFSKMGMGPTFEVDAQGNSTIDGEPSGDTSYVAAFQSWRTTVEEVLRPWTELPDPGYLDHYVGTLRSQMTRLLDPEDLTSEDFDPSSSSGSGSADDFAAGGELHSRLETIDTKLGNMSGQTAAKMYEVLVTKLGDVTRAEFATVGILGIHLQGEKQIFEETRKDVAELFDGCLGVMEAYGNVGGDSLLGVFTALLGVGSAFGGPSAPALGAAAAVIGLADAVLPDPPPPNPIEVYLFGADPDAAWTAMVEALDKVNRSISDQESDLSSRLSKVSGTVAHGPAFDLSRVSGEGSDPGGLATGDVMHIDKGGLRYIAEDSLPLASGDFVAIAAAVEGVNPEWALTRPANIGFGATGIMPAWEGARDDVSTAITGTAGELMELRAAVIKVLEDFGETDIDQSNVYRAMVQDTATRQYQMGQPIPY